MCQNPLEDEVSNNLLHGIWQILTLNGENYHEPGVTERNLVIFIQGVENIYLENMICKYPLVSKEARLVGFFINEYYYLESE